MPEMEVIIPRFAERQLRLLPCLAALLLTGIIPRFLLLSFPSTL